MAAAVVVVVVGEEGVRLVGAAATMTRQLMLQLVLQHSEVMVAC